MSTYTFLLPGGATDTPPTVEADLASGMVDHVAVGVSRLPSQFSNSPGVINLLKAYLQGFQNLEVAAYAFFAGLSVFTATNAQLDLLGRIVGQLRGNLSDTDYRRYIFARIATNRSHGTANQLIGITNGILNSATSVVTAIEYPPNECVINVAGVTVDVNLANALITFLNQARALGVHLILETDYVADTAQCFFDTVAFGSGTLSIGSTLISVSPGVPLSQFGSSGSLILDQGLATQETVTWSGVNTSAFGSGPRFVNQFLNVSATTQAHTNVTCSLVGTPGLGLGDSTSGSVGGALGSARDSVYTAA